MVVCGIHWFTSQLLTDLEIDPNRKDHRLYLQNTATSIIYIKQISPEQQLCLGVQKEQTPLAETVLFVFYVYFFVA